MIDRLNNNRPLSIERAPDQDSRPLGGFKLSASVVVGVGGKLFRVRLVRVENANKKHSIKFHTVVTFALEQQEHQLQSVTVGQPVKGLSENRPAGR